MNYKQKKRNKTLAYQPWHLTFVQRAVGPWAVGLRNENQL